MTATDELRRMLDERGVGWHGDIATYWGDADAVESVFADNALDVALYAISPEQAIEATLGRWTCKWEPADFITEGEWWNTSCGESFTWEPDGTPNYCPNCGRRVVVGDES